MTTPFSLLALAEFFFIIQCLSWTRVSSECPSEFEDMCDCGLVPYGKRITYVTNCTNAAFDNVGMLRKLPPSTEVLLFVGNEIKDLPLNIFGLDTVYDKLHTIDFSNNHIQTIKGRTFHNVANVTKLILNNNDLYIVSKDHHPRMFSNFVNLKELHLRNAFTEKVKAGDYLNNLAQIFENSSLNHLKVLNMENNEISDIHRGEFCSLPSLEQLYLSDNRLKDVPMNFSCMKNLKLLDVGNNHIRFLSDSTIQSLDRTKRLRLNLTSNPLTCDCNLVNTHKWLKRTSLDLENSENLYCFDGLPPTIGKAIVSINTEDLQCVQTLNELNYHSSASFVILSLGFIAVAIVLGMLVYKNKICVGASLRRVLQPIRCKFHYVSLERRDETMDV